MSIKMLKAPVAGLVLSISSFANAGLILEGSTDVTVDGNILIQSDKTVSNVSFGGLSEEGTIPNSAWVWADDNSSDVQFTFSFDLYGYDVSTAELTGLWGARNSGTVALNGVTIANPNRNNFSQLDQLPNGSGNFNVGDNVLTFKLSGNNGNNGNNQNAFRASVQVFAETLKVTEPTTLALFALGMMGFVARHSLSVNKKQ